MCVQRSGADRRAHDGRSCAYAGVDTAEDFGKQLHGIFEGQISDDDLRISCELEIQIRDRHFWADGYYVSTVGLNEATVRKYIQDQEKDDIAKDKLSVKEYEDPFGEDKQVRKEKPNKK